MQALFWLASQIFSSEIAAKGVEGGKRTWSREWDEGEDHAGTASDGRVVSTRWTGLSRAETFGDGGCIPLLGAAIFLLMTNWRQGVEAMRGKLAAQEVDRSWFLSSLDRIAQMRGAAVFLTCGTLVLSPLLVRYIEQTEAL